MSDRPIAHLFYGVVYTVDAFYALARDGGAGDDPYEWLNAETQRLGLECCWFGYGTLGHSHVGIGRPVHEAHVDDGPQPVTWGAADEVAVRRAVIELTGHTNPTLGWYLGAEDG